MTQRALRDLVERAKEPDHDTLRPSSDVEAQAVLSWKIRCDTNAGRRR